MTTTSLPFHVRQRIDVLGALLDTFDRLEYANDVQDIKEAAWLVAHFPEFDWLHQLLPMRRPLLFYHVESMSHLYRMSATRREALEHCKFNSERMDRVGEVAMLLLRLEGDR